MSYVAEVKITRADLADHEIPDWLEERIQQSQKAQALLDFLHSTVKHGFVECKPDVCLGKLKESGWDLVRIENDQ